MPALKWCGRRWTAGSDDFVVFGYSYGIINFILGLTSMFFVSPIVGPLVDLCPQSSPQFHQGVTFLMVLHWINAAIFCALAVASVRGRIFEVSKRSLVPLLLYVAAVGILIELAAGAYTTHDTFTEAQVDSCSSVTVRAFFRFFALSNLLLSIAFIVTCIFHFDTQGRKKFDSMESYEKVWYNRCRLMCCCYYGSDREEAFEGASHSLALLFQGLDIVPSDIAAGLVLLQHYQSMALRRRTRDIVFAPPAPITATKRDDTTASKESTPISTPQGTPTSAPEKVSTEARRFHPLTDEHRSEIEEIVKYSPFYLAAYGFLLYWYQNLFTGMPRLWATDCTMCCRARPGVHVGQCCYCDNTALRQVAGLRDEDILFTHFKSAVYLPAFYVALEPNRPVVIIAIRGTMSLQDCLTDAIAAPVAVEVQGVTDAYAHSGMLRSARNILEVLSHQRLVDDIVNGAYSEHRVVILGHSLGAGTAVMLSILLREAYPDQLKHRMKCIAYGPPGGLLSKNLSEYTRSYVVGCFAGKDLVPRLSQHSMALLRDGMLKALAAAKCSKARVLCHVCCPARGDLLHSSIDEAADEGVEKLGVYFASPLRNVEEDNLSVRLYPPAKMVWFAKACTSYGCCACLCPESLLTNYCYLCSDSTYVPNYISVDELQEILVSPSMAADHFPDRFFAVLKTTMQRLENGELDRFMFPSSQPGAVHHRSDIPIVYTGLRQVPSRSHTPGAPPLGEETISDDGSGGHRQVIRIPSGTYGSVNPRDAEA